MTFLNMRTGSDTNGVSRRRFFRDAALAVAGTAAFPAWAEGAGESVTMPFDNGGRPLVKYPQKRPLIRLTTRPPQLETPFEVFNESLLTPNDAFFVRYHLTLSPPSREALAPDKFRLSVKGKVATPLAFSMEELTRRFETAEVTAINQCSGNSRGFFKPRIPGGQLGHGAMGCARWRGVRLADVLKAAAPAATARHVLFNGLDAPFVPQTPDFIKSLEVDQALDPEILLAYEMNGEPLPWLNGFPLRMVVPGHYGTYWVKHLHEITVVDEGFTGFWMNPGYRIPDDPCAAIEPGTTPKRTVPISRLNVRSFITSVTEGATLKAGVTTILRGIAFDDGHGIRDVVVSDDAGRTWRGAELGRLVDRYAFREWTLAYNPTRTGKVALMSRATNRLGQSQPMEPLWNPAGYMRNCVEPVNVQVS